MTPAELGFGAIARVSPEEFRQIVQENVQKQGTGDSTPEEGTIRVQKGVFKGMTGKLLHADGCRESITEMMTGRRGWQSSVFFRFFPMESKSG